MSGTAPGAGAVRVLRGRPAPEELAAVLTALVAALAGSGAPPGAPADTPEPAPWAHSSFPSPTGRTTWRTP
ncbi:acyl-CoA carboxylase epsilon subunit [Streptomyces cinerochromogenes]|uniref:acyl-CoA carboxylase epsilon subunit n=1 Tax=Streptomyces cinerochromogenes TaxID=66422 RepID=UPI001670F51B|nr:acyl-CoA carboxylase epsilon subunit [Streptomyces cinerochromogenes]GGS91823.1 hypothetical protein GCM10010206_63270 [Streptomyces cinerochromogenes]